MSSNPKSDQDVAQALTRRARLLPTMSETLLAFKAGRAHRRSSTNFVDARPEKGAIILTNGDDGLLHFMWKNRTTGNVEEVRCFWASFGVIGSTHECGIGSYPFPIRCVVRQGSSNRRWKGVRTQVLFI